MMDSCDSDDVVTDEKVNLLHRYKLFLNFANLFQLGEFFITVALIFWSSSRIIAVLNDLNLSGGYLLTFSSNLFNQHVVFLIGNVIIVACYLLSRRTDEGNKSEKYDEKLISSSHRKTTGDGSIGDSVTPSPEKMVVTEETFGEEKTEKPNQEVCYDNGVVKLTEPETAMELEVAVKKAVKQIERFRRTQSEKLKREMSIKPHRELRRWVTAERSGVLVTSGDGRSSETVEEMSNEEFRVAVETFISKQQSLLKVEGINCN